MTHLKQQNILEDSSLFLFLSFSLMNKKFQSSLYNKIYTEASTLKKAGFLSVFIIFLYVCYIYETCECKDGNTSIVETSVMVFLQNRNKKERNFTIYTKTEVLFCLLKF